MPKTIKQEDTDLYRKLLLGFSFGQLALGILYFMFAAINPADPRRSAGDQRRLYAVDQGLLGG